MITGYESNYPPIPKHQRENRPVRPGLASTMRGEEMTEDTKTGPLSKASALMTSIGGAILPPDDVIAMESNRRGVYANAQKAIEL
jgi:hypothetical protein